jgi:Methyltransferase domain
VISRTLPPGVRARLRGVLHRVLERYAAGIGLDVVPRGFYSPLPAVDELPEEVWTRRSPLEGIHFDSAEQLQFVKENLARHIPEFDPDFDTGTSCGSYDIRNLAYDEVDSELLYAFVRFLRPARVIELGSGFSSLVLAHACEANRMDGNACAYEIFDPHPRPFIRELPGLTGQHESPAQDVPIEAFEALGENDILFVDTTHTVKIGSEVNRIVLDVLPRLASGVVVQFHDIFSPWEYHRHWIEGDWKWNEQYLLQAFLSMNPSYEVLVSCQALVRERAEELAKLVPTLRRESAPSAFWMRRR